MSAVMSQITSLTIGYSTVYSDTDQGKHQSSASLAFVWGIHRRPVNSPLKWPVTRKMFPFDDVIMQYSGLSTRRDKVIILCLVQIDENIFAWDVIKFAFWYLNVHVQLWLSSQCCRIKHMTRYYPKYHTFQCLKLKRTQLRHPILNWMVNCVTFENSPVLRESIASEVALSLDMGSVCNISRKWRRRDMGLLPDT